MTNAIVKRELTPDLWSMIQQVAPVIQKSRLFGVATAEQAMAIMLKGSELGLPMAASFEFIQVIADKPTLSPRGALALIIQSGECEGLKITDESNEKGIPTACTVWMKRKNGFEYTARFTMEDAKRALLTDKSGMWEKYPANMLRYRAIGYCSDIVFPDVIGGMKRADELGADITPDGDVINATWTEVKPTPPPPTKDTPSIMLADLVNQYGGTAVLAVSDGNLPQTVEGVFELKAKLEARQKDLESISVDSVQSMKA